MWIPFPVMGGKHGIVLPILPLVTVNHHYQTSLTIINHHYGIVLPTFPNRCIQLLQIPGAKNASPHQELCRSLLDLALFKRLTSETLRNIMSEYVHVCICIYICIVCIVIIVIYICIIMSDMYN